MSCEATVFVVDDDSATRDSLRWLVRSVGLRVEAYDSAEAFLERYGPNCRGCVVLDVRMPGLSGLELQERLNRDGASPPVILVTGHGDVPMAVRALKGGAYDFVEKPIREQEMLDRIQRALAYDAERWLSRERERELERRVASLTAREREVFSRGRARQAEQGDRHRPPDSARRRSRCTGRT